MMMLTLEALLDDLWKRWEKHLLHPDLERQPKGSRTVYSQGIRFHMQDWHRPLLAPGGRLLATPIKGNHYEYELDQSGKPLSVVHQGVLNKAKISWRGVFRYLPNEIEFVEFCIQTGVPSTYHRVTLAGQLPASRQFLSIVAGGYNPTWRSMSAEKIREAIRSNPHTHSYRVERYESSEERLSWGECLYGPNGASHWTLSFSYAPDGALQRVTQKWDTGAAAIAYQARTKVSLRVLSRNVASRIATTVAERLNEVRFASPLVAIELSYKAVENYLPLVIAYTESDEIDSFPVLDPEKSGHRIELHADDLEPELAEFNGRILESEKWTEGAKMLREAARLLTQHQSLGVPTAEAFVAFAIDWELEIDNFSRILRACGADAKSIRAWKARGWLS